MKCIDISKLQAKRQLDSGFGSVVLCAEAAYVLYGFIDPYSNLIVVCPLYVYILIDHQDETLHMHIDIVKLPYSLHCMSCS